TSRPVQHELALGRRQFRDNLISQLTFLWRQMRQAVPTWLSRPPSLPGARETVQITSVNDRHRVSSRGGKQLYRLINRRPAFQPATQRPSLDRFLYGFPYIAK